MQLRRSLSVAKSISCLLLLSARFTTATPTSRQPSYTDYSTPGLEQQPLILQEPLDQESNLSLRDRVLEYAWRWLGRANEVKPHILQLPPSELPGHLRAQYAPQVVLRFNVSTAVEVTALIEAVDILFLDVWESSGEWVDIRLAVDVVPSLLGLLPASLQHAHLPLMTGNDLVRAIAETYPQSSRHGAVTASTIAYKHYAPTSQPLQSRIDDSYFDEYRPLSVMRSWMGLQELMFPGHTKLLSIGKSYEGRDILALRVGAPRTEPERLRKTIIISGGSHAREWISTSTVNYVAHAIISSYGRKRAATRLLEEFDFIFVPTLNPDGYQYTWDTDRLWRKNRQPTPLRFCRGLDLDRTWSYKWDEAARDNPCSESFAGQGPFEGIESNAFAKWTRNETANNNIDIVGLLDLHSYSEQILYPYSFSCNEAPPTLEDLEELGQGLAKAIRSQHHVNYKVIPACEGNVALSGSILPKMENGGGSLLDWFYHEMKVRNAFQIKLRDKGSYGFLLPKEYIKPTGTETLRAVLYLGKSLSALSYSDMEMYAGLDE